MGLEEGWHAARLIPAIGIKGQEEQEKRATSSLLAVLRAVPEFGHALLGPLGAPKGRISTYTEVQVKDTAGRSHIPDGAIVIERGRTTWMCLVEVKTGSAKLEADQVNRYLDWARENRLDGVLTLSNQITSSPADSPVPVDGRKLRSVKLHHLSWWRVITEAIVQHRHRGVSDPDQAWLLGELIAYLDDDRSGASGFRDMGESWVKVRDGAGNGTLRATDAEVRSVAERWDQFVEYLCLGLGQDLGREVKPVRPRKQTATTRLDQTATMLATDGRVEAAIRVPDAAGPLVLRADLRAKSVITSVTVDAPLDGRPTTKVNWLLRQLKDAPDDLVIEVSFANSKATTAGLMTAAREHPPRLLLPNDAKRSPRSFRLALARPMGTKRGKGERSFVLETRKQAIDFYRELVQDLRPWRPSAPRLPEDPEDVATTPSPEAPSFSGVGREPTEGTPDRVAT
jgi:hypothetical protein